MKAILNNTEQQHSHFLTSSINYFCTIHFNNLLMFTVHVEKNEAEVCKKSVYLIIKKQDKITNRF